MIKIMVDSTCDLPESIIKTYDIRVLPLKISLEGKEYRDKETIQVDEVYAAMRRGIIPRTSLPNPRDIYAMFEDYCTKGQDFIYLAFSSALSGTCQLACSILKEFKARYPLINMKVIDTKAGSAATGLIALRTLKLIKSGCSFTGIVEKVQELAKGVEHIFTVADLNWLVKGGRLSKAKGLIGSILDIKPIIHVNDGYMEVIKKVRGGKKVLETIVDIMAERGASLKNQIIGISYAADAAISEQMKELIRERLGCNNFMINKIGSVLAAHLGIGGVGVFFFNKNVPVL
jgi:DegV family protein with EDD domain